MTPIRTTAALAVLLATACGGDDGGQAASTGGSSSGADGGSSSGPSTMSGTMSTTNSTTVSTTDSTTTGTMTGTDTSTGCSGNEECPDGMPFCVGMVCVTCDATDDPDASCADLDDTTPVCSGSECVQCSDANDGACEGTTPICDAGTNTCVGCSFHSDCPDSACKIDTGECFDPADVSTVDANNLQSAIDGVAAGGDAVFMVDGSTDLEHSITIDGNKAIALLRADRLQLGWSTWAAAATPASTSPAPAPASTSRTWTSARAATSASPSTPPPSTSTKPAS